ncbi:hypothetical protein K458DRAFT_44748 [Lentithecium fluviatile CBS 122367]|uniref:Uncharacterized protein n=1 Tax=Lentithecium fluviatile CBS 122367 TaxID=1168545 RepID=A0A6G1IYH6_9PLEO|nr:hypothetical protein K458DRAFT_44748 [Lentithecium fluviatile CBS 122367]
MMSVSQSRDSLSAPIASSQGSISQHFWAAATQSGLYDAVGCFDTIELRNRRARRVDVESPLRGPCAKCGGQMACSAEPNNQTTKERTHVLETANEPPPRPPLSLGNFPHVLWRLTCVTFKGLKRSRRQAPHATGSYNCDIRAEAHSRLVAILCIAMPSFLTLMVSFLRKSRKYEARKYSVKLRQTPSDGLLARSVAASRNMRPKRESVLSCARLGSTPSRNKPQACSALRQLPACRFFPTCRNIWIEPRSARQHSDYIITIHACTSSTR